MSKINKKSFESKLKLLQQLTQKMAKKNNYTKKKKQTTNTTYEKSKTYAPKNIFQDPFTPNYDLRIPDGRFSLSAPVTRQKQGLVTTGPEGRLYIALIPDYQFPVVWENEIENASENFRFLLGDTDLDIHQQEQVKEWRYVNCGMKISCMDSWDDQAGFWEAIRVPTADDRFECHDDLYKWARDVNFSDQPSYCHGTIKQLKNVFFQLKPSGDVGTSFGLQHTIDHTRDSILVKIHGKTLNMEKAKAEEELFDTDAPDDPDVDADGDQDMPGENGAAPGGENDADNMDQENEGDDQDIKKDGLGQESMVNEKDRHFVGSKFIIHVISNLEVVYEQNGLLDRTMKTTKLNRSWKNMVAQSAADLKAATPNKSVSYKSHNFKKRQNVRKQKNYKKRI